MPWCGPKKTKKQNKTKKQRGTLWFPSAQVRPDRQAVGGVLKEGEGSGWGSPQQGGEGEEFSSAWGGEGAEFVRPGPMSSSGSRGQAGHSTSPQAALYLELQCHTQCFSARSLG